MKAIVVAALIAGFSTVQGMAAPIDLSAQTCKQFQASSPDEIKIILAWLDGYYKDEKATSETIGLRNALFYAMTGEPFHRDRPRRSECQGPGNLTLPGPFGAGLGAQPLLAVAE